MDFCFVACKEKVQQEKASADVHPPPQAVNWTNNTKPVLTFILPCKLDQTHLGICTFLLSYTDTIFPFSPLLKLCVSSSGLQVHQSLEQLPNHPNASEDSVGSSLTLSHPQVSCCTLIKQSTSWKNNPSEQHQIHIPDLCS